VLCYSIESEIVFVRSNRISMCRVTLLCLEFLFVRSNRISTCRVTESFDITYNININMNSTSSNPFTNIVSDELFKNIPIVEILTGLTGYNDQVDNNTLGDNVIGRGYDQFERHTVCFRVEIRDIETRTVTEQAYYSIFYRYNNDDLLVYCISHYSKLRSYDEGSLCVILGPTALNEESKVILKNIFSYYEIGEIYMTTDKKFTVALVAEFSKI